jgi:hypothetical protein
MMFRPRTVASVLALTVAVGVGALAPSASAQGDSVSGPCGLATGPHLQGATGGTVAVVCSAGSSLVSGAVGQIVSVVGPTVNGGGAVANVVVSGGDGIAP